MRDGRIGARERRRLHQRRRARHDSSEFVKDDKRAEHSRLRQHRDTGRRIRRRREGPVVHRLAGWQFGSGGPQRRSGVPKWCGDRGFQPYIQRRGDTRHRGKETGHVRKRLITGRRHCGRRQRSSDRRRGGRQISECADERGQVGGYRAAIPGGQERRRFRRHRRVGESERTVLDRHRIGRRLTRREHAHHRLRGEVAGADLPRRHDVEGRHRRAVRRLDNRRFGAQRRFDQSRAEQCHHRQNQRAGREHPDEDITADQRFGLSY